MQELIPIALFGWIPLTLAVFLIASPRRALLFCLLGGWLFLPNAGVDIQHLPDFTREAAISIAALLGMAIFAPSRLLAFRPRFFDLPMLVWCLCPIASSLHNELGLYDGLSASLEQMLNWGIPYVLGRCMLNDLQALREAALALIVAAIVYAPLCLWEMRMSPQIHTLVYGMDPYIDLRPNALHLGIEWYRPNVFMMQGLNVSMLFACAAVCAVWLWRSGSVRRLGPFSMQHVTAGLVLMVLLCQVLGSLTLLLMGVMIWFGIRWMRSPIPVACLIALAPGYILVRASGEWSGESLVSAVESINAERAESLLYRIDNEDQLANKALEKPLFGWGRWGRSRVYDDHGEDISITDGLWIIALGRSGLVGLISLVTVVLLPLVVLWFKQPARNWLHPEFAAAGVMAIVIGMFMINNVMNALVTPYFTAVIGGLFGLILATRSAPRTVAHRSHMSNHNIPTTATVVMGTSRSETI